MLVLTRRSNQSIMIGDEVEISILSVSGEKVRVGIDAPDEVPVFRKEVYLRIESERADGNGSRPNSESRDPKSESVEELAGTD
jgi:carbon storage regulator